MEKIVKNNDEISFLDMDTEPYSLYPTENSINIRWFSETPYCGKIIFREAGSDEEQFTEEKIPSISHSVYLSGLKPFTKYKYHICPDGKEYSFYTTASTDCDSFRFAVFGDPQGHKHLQETMTVAAEFNPHFAIGLGDFAGAAKHELYLKFIRLSRMLLDNVTLFPSPGNHDYRRHNGPFNYDNDTITYDLFWGDNNGNNYFFDYGKFRFIMLNYPDSGTVKADDKTGTWLRQQLETARRLNKKVILSHHCACFTSTEAAWAVDDSLVPPLAKEFADVLLVDFGGHIHTYERSMYPDDNGTCFITSGGAGELYLQYPVNQRKNIFQKSAVELCHVCLVEIKDNQVSIEAVDMDGKCFDRTIINAVDKNNRIAKN